MKFNFKVIIDCDRMIELFVFYKFILNFLYIIYSLLLEIFY